MIAALEYWFKAANDGMISRQNNLLVSDTIRTDYLERTNCMTVKPNVHYDSRLCLPLSRTYILLQLGLLNSDRPNANCRCGGFGADS